MEFLDGTRWKKVLAEAVKRAYSDIFVMKREPAQADVQMIAGKYKSTYNMSDTASDRAARTFLSLLDLADKETVLGVAEDNNLNRESVVETPPEDPLDTAPPIVPEKQPVSGGDAGTPIGLNYNIQIHLPATKDVEVYNAIFKSLREHIID